MRKHKRCIYRYIVIKLNAKELILEKINAAPELAGIYIYSLMTGIQFNDIADFMTTKIVSKILSKSRKNLYLPLSKYNNVNLAIKYYSEGASLSSYIFDIGKVNGVKYLFLLYAKLHNIKNTDIEDYISNLDSEDLGTFYNSFMQFIGMKDIPNIEGRPMYSEEDEEDIDFFLEDDTLTEEVDDYYELTQRAKKSTDETKTYLHRFFLDSISRQYDIEDIGIGIGKILETLLTLLKLLDSALEVTILGRGASLNLGIKTKLNDKISFELLIEGFVNTKLRESELFKNSELKTIISDKYLKFGDIFDFLMFTSNSEYRNDIILAYELAKDTFNILDIWMTIPHFREMFIAYGIDNTIQSTYMPIAYALLKSLSKGYIQGRLISQSDAKKRGVIDRFLSDVLTYKFLSNSLYNITVYPGLKIYYNKAKTISADLRILDFSNPNDIATFKGLVEFDILNKLKLTYPKNLFILSLTMNSFTDPYGNSYKFLLLPLSVDTLDQEGNNLLFALFLLEFNSIRTDLVPGLEMNILDLFFLYNLIANSNRPGSSTLTKIFADTLDTKESIIKDYNLFLATSEITKSDYSEGDLVFRLLDNELDWSGYTRTFNPKTSSPIFTYGSNTLDMNTLQGAVKLPIFAGTVTNMDRLFTSKVLENLLKLALLNLLEIKLKCDE